VLFGHLESECYQQVYAGNRDRSNLPQVLPVSNAQAYTVRSATAEKGGKFLDNMIALCQMDPMATSTHRIDLVRSVYCNFRA
jgi:hypothetical protein